jgi:beta-lactamase regulating signal transducer with metallopeptidase domain
MALPSLTECAAAFDHLAPALLLAAAASAMVLGLAGLTTLAMRRASAAARHEAWLLGFAGALLLPLLSVAVPGWPILPRSGTRRPAIIAGGVVPAAPLVASARLSAPPPSASTPAQETIMSAHHPLLSAGSPPATAMARLSLKSNERVSPSAQSARAGRFGSFSWRAWVLLCWLAGTLLVMCRVLLGHLSLWSLNRRCARITRGDLPGLLERLRGELGLRRPVELLSSPRRTMPMTWGLWRARLLVPEQASAWPPGQRRDVLLHELAHVKRCDCLTQFLSQVACALYWFNPLAWVASRRMQIERERACDDLVLNRGAEASAYARHLLDSISSLPPFRLAGAAVAMARPSTLEERMRAILDGRMNRRPLTARGSLATILLLLSALAPVAVLKAQQAPPADKPPANSGPAQPARDAKDVPPGPPATRPAPPRHAGPAVPGYRASGRAGFGAPAAPTLGQGPTCTLDATLYDVRMPLDQIGKLDVAALSRAAENAGEFEKALAALGTVKPMYRADQSVRLSGDTISITSSLPFVTNSRITDKGQMLNSVQYRSTGAIFTLAGKAAATGSGAVDLDLAVQLSASTEGGVAIADKLKAPVIRNVTLSHKGPVQPGKAFVVLSIDAGAVDEDGKAVAYIGRITLGEPQPAAPR